MKSDHQGSVMQECQESKREERESNEGEKEEESEGEKEEESEGEKEEERRTDVNVTSNMLFEVLPRMDQGSNFFPSDHHQRIPFPFSSKNSFPLSSSESSSSSPCHQ